MTDIDSARIRRAFRPPPKISVSAWAEASVVLPSDKASRPGPIRMTWTPYWREPLDALSDDYTETVVFMTCTQVGKTTALLIAALYFLDQDPSQVQLVMPRDTDSVEICQHRLKPILEASPALAHLIPEGKSGYLRQCISTGAATAYFTGANSAAALAQRSCRVLLPDEVDKYKDHLGRETDPVSLLMERAKTFHDRKILMASTPTTGDGLIYREYQSGDKRAYHCPCPSCGHYQELEFEQLKWPDAEGCGADGQAEHAAIVAREGLAHFECKGCSAELREHQKGPMLEKGVWVPEGGTVDASGQVTGGKRLSVRSYHLSTMCSRWVTWSEMAAEFIRSKGNAEKVRSFQNNWQGLPWEERVAATSVTTLSERAKDYERATAPDGVQVLTAGVDVQKDYLVWSIRGWGYDQESWLIDYGRCGDWETLANLLFRSDYSGKGVSMACVDSSYEPHSVYGFCKEWKAACRPVFGRTNLVGAPLSDPRSVEKTASGKRARFGLKYWVANSNFYKDKLSDLQSRPVDGPGWWIFEDADQEYLRQVTAEHKIQDRKGKLTWKPKSKGRANHYWDAEVLNVVAADMMGVYAMREPVKNAPPPAQPNMRGPGIRDQPHYMQRRERALNPQLFGNKRKGPPQKRGRAW